MTATRRALLPFLVTAALPLFVACGSGGETPGGGAGSGGTTGGSGGTAGTGGTAGSAAGTGGTGGTAGGGAGAGGNAGSAPGSGGAAGSSAGSGGAAGAAAGSGGNAGASAGSGGDASGGAAGSSGGMSSGGAAGSSGGMSAGGAAGAAGAAAGASGNAGSGGGGGGGTFTLVIEGFTPTAGCADDMRDDCAVWPRDLQYWMQGPNLSPAMTWLNPPAGTMSFAVSLEDLTNGNDHWVLWNLPSSTLMLAEDVPDDRMNQASIGSGNGYFGPGSNCNVYEFTVYALGMATFSPNDATDPEAVFMQLNALGGQLLGKASVRGRQNFSGTCDP